MPENLESECNMIESGNFASESSNNSGMSRDQNLIEQARQMATPSGDSQPDDDKPKHGSNMTRRAFAIGGGVLALGAIGAGAWWLFLRPQDNATSEPAADSASSATKETQVAKKETIDARGEKLVAGKDIATGPWFAQGFLPSAKPWLEITREKDTFSLDKPTDKDAMDWWANQVTIFELAEGDQLCANATITPLTPNPNLATSLGNLPDLRSGLYVVGIDLAEGEYDITPHEVIDDIDTKTGAAMEGDLTWQGRISGAISLAALAQGMDIPAIESTYRGVIVSNHDTLLEAFGPIYGATLPFSCEALTGTPNPAKATTKNEEASTNQTTTDPQQNPNQNQTQPAAGSDSPAKTAYANMTKQQQNTLDALIKILKDKNAFIPASQKTVKLKANDFVMPIMVDLSLQRSTSKGSQNDSSTDEKPELTNSTLSDKTDSSVFS
jgi:hypothetical protein